MCNFTISNSQFCLKKKDKKKVKLILVVDFISPNLSIGKDSDAGRDWGRVRHDTHRTCAYLEGRLTGAAPRRAQAPHATSEGLEGGFTSLLRAGGFGSVLRECTVAMNTPSTT